MQPIGYVRQVAGLLERTIRSGNGGVPAAPGQGPAHHVHRRIDEAFYVLAGRFAFTRGDDELEATPGSLVFIPKGTRHRYRACEDDSRVLILYVPAGGFDDFWRELDGLLAGGLTSGQAMARLKGKYDSDPA